MFHVAYYIVKYTCSRNRHTQELSKANCSTRFNCWKTAAEKDLFSDVNYHITRLKLNWHKLNKHASLTKNTANINTKQTKPRFSRLLRPPAWKRSGSIFWKVRDRRRDRREGKMHKKGRRKNTNRKGKQKQTRNVGQCPTWWPSCQI